MDFSLILLRACILVALLCIAYFFRLLWKQPLYRANKRIRELELEMLASHREILELQKENSRLGNGNKAEEPVTYMYSLSPAKEA